MFELEEEFFSNRRRHSSGIHCWSGGWSYRSSSLVTKPLALATLMDRPSVLVVC